jgi:hypothetical protein
LLFCSLAAVSSSALSPTSPAALRQGSLQAASANTAITVSVERLDPALDQLVPEAFLIIPGAHRHKPGAAPDRANLQLLIKELPRPNGIASSPDEKCLYVDNSQPETLEPLHSGSLLGCRKELSR